MVHNLMVTLLMNKLVHNYRFHCFVSLLLLRLLLLLFELDWRSVDAVLELLRKQLEIWPASQLLMRKLVDADAGASQAGLVELQE